MARAAYRVVRLLRVAAVAAPASRCPSRVIRGGRSAAERNAGRPERVGEACLPLTGPPAASEPLPPGTVSDASIVRCPCLAARASSATPITSPHSPRAAMPSPARAHASSDAHRRGPARPAAPRRCKERHAAGPTPRAQHTWAVRTADLHCQHCWMWRRWVSWLARPVVPAASPGSRSARPFGARVRRRARARR